MANIGRYNMRGLSGKFITELKSGLLRPILIRVKKDDTLMLAIRAGYINIYYRGGNILKITEYQHYFDFHFEKKYDLSEGHKTYKALSLPQKITEPAQIEKWVLSISTLKELMDFWFNKHPRLEREFQQLVERENNRSSISGETEYFITDIEYANSSINARFDILAIKWPASGTGRRSGKNCKASFIEMKYGDKALSGKASLIKHIRDINGFLANEQNYLNILNVIETQFNQLDELGLLKFNHGKSNAKVKLSPSDKPEFIYLLANHNPRSSKLKSILTDPEFKKFVASDYFDLRFYVSSDAGYGMNDKNVLSYEEYIRRF